MIATYRYRAREFYPAHRNATEDIIEATTYQAAPPGYVLVMFDTEVAKSYFDELLGPPIEPNYSLDLDDYKDYSRTKKYRSGERT